jgi:hypothetical protein
MADVVEVFLPNRDTTDPWTPGYYADVALYVSAFRLGGLIPDAPCGGTRLVAARELSRGLPLRPAGGPDQNPRCGASRLTIGPLIS